LLALSSWTAVTLRWRSRASTIQCRLTAGV